MAKLTELHPNLWIVDVNLPEYSVRGAVIVGKQQAIVWDTLTHPDDMTDVMSIIGDLPYHVVYSHADWDHIWGTAGLSREPLSIIGQRHCLERFGLDVPETLKQMQAETPGKWDNVKLVPPTRTFDAELVLDLGDLKLELHHLPGHTQDCIVGWIPEWGILLGGDVMETPLPVVYEDSPVTEWLASLQKWAEKESLRRTIPAHGTIEGRECLDSTIRYLQQLLGEGEVSVSSNLDEFYHNTHQKNLQIVRGA